MKVYLVGISDCESTEIVCICATRQIAEREILKARDKLIEEYKEQKISNEKFEKEFIENRAKVGIHFGFTIDGENMYDTMIKNLSSDDYKNWENYPHEVPYIEEREVID